VAGALRSVAAVVIGATSRKPGTWFRIVSSPIVTIASTANPAWPTWLRGVLPVRFLPHQREGEEGARRWQW